MSSRASAVLTLAALAVLATAGCRREVDRISSSDYMLDLLVGYWRRAREALKSEKPDLASFRAIQTNLRGRVQASVEAGYTGPNKQAVVDKLKVITAAYRAEVLTRLDTGSRVVQLRQGVKLADLRKAFEKVDREFRELEALIAAE
jgi:hypothetical protein